MSKAITTTATATMVPIASLQSATRAMTATFDTAELLEHILSYLPALQLLRAKATCRHFRNAIEASPALKRKMRTLIRLGDVDESDLFKTDAGGDVIYPVKGLDPLAFFYPSDAETRLFVRVSTDPGRFEMMRKSSGFLSLIVVDQPLVEATVGWHCSCFANTRSEVKLSSLQGDKVAFGDIVKAMETEHKLHGHEACGSVTKFWLDGLWRRTSEMRELGH